MKNLLILFILLLISSCKNHYNESIAWMDQLNHGLSFEDIKRQKPDFIDIDWENPLIINNEKWYAIDKIKGSNDILNMQHYLVFEDNKYKGRNSIK
jgi:hypothetical protein